MANTCSLRLVANNQWPAATLTATPAITSLDNTKQLLRSLKATTTNNASQTINFSWGHARSVDAFWLQLPTDSVATLTLYSGANQTGTLLATVLLTKGSYVPIGVFTVGVHAIGEYQDFFANYRPQYFDEVSAMSGRITLTSTVAVTKVLRTIVIGKSWQPSVGATVGVTVGMRSDAQTIRTAGGSLVQLRGLVRWREMSVDLDRMTDADRIALYDELSTAMNGILVDVLPTVGSDLRVQHIMLANLALPDLVNMKQFHTTKLNFTEV